MDGIVGAVALILLVTLIGLLVGLFYASYVAYVEDASQSTLIRCERICIAAMFAFVPVLAIAILASSTVIGLFPVIIAVAGLGWSLFLFIRFRTVLRRQ
jgi:hypothetical protein